jgi:hypothetical protein
LTTEPRKSGHGAKSAAQQHVVAAEEAGQRLDKLLGQLLPAVPRTRIFRLIRKGEVRVDGRRSSPERRVLEGERVRVPPVHERSESAQLAVAGAAARVPPALIARVSAAILHEDERLLVLDKPAGRRARSGLSYVIEGRCAPLVNCSTGASSRSHTSGILMSLAVGPARSMPRCAMAVSRRATRPRGGRWELGRAHRRAAPHGCQGRWRAYRCAWAKGSPARTRAGCSV